jgi:shikimate kinase
MQDAPLPLSEKAQEHVDALKTHPALTRLVFTGFMGCGKSTLGRKLASVLGFRFVDTDNAIEHFHHKKIARIFQEDGEATFRNYESDCLAHCLSQDHTVIATGGGALVRQDNLDLALDNAIVIYIEMDENDLLERVMFSPKERPLINVKDPSTVVKRLYAERTPFYEQAQVHVQTGDLKPQEALEAVIESLYNYVTYFLPSVSRNVSSAEPV